MNVYTLNKTYSLGSNSYLLEADGEYAVIDPSTNPDSLSFDFNALKYVILTHTHFDHMLFIDEWLRKSGAELIVGQNDELGLADSEFNCCKQFLRREKSYKGPFSTVGDCDRLPLGNEYIEVIKTAGHTRGSISLMVNNSLFVGDAVFSGGSYGRCDLPGGDYKTLMKSISRLLTFPDTFKVYPGHGPATTILDLKQQLYYY